MAGGSGGRSGAQSRTFNQEIFEKKFAFAGVERTAAAKACHITLGRWPWQGFKSDNFVLCRADGAMEQRCYRFHTHPRICDPVWSSSVAPLLHRCLGGSRSPGPLANRHTQGNSTPARTSLGNDAAWASFRPRFPGPTMELEASYCSLFGLATSDWSVKLMPLEQVGGRAHEAQFGFVWNGGGAA